MKNKRGVTINIIALKLLIVLIFSFQSSVTAQAKANIPTRIIIKFLPGSLIYNSWLQGGRNSAFSVFNTLLGEHTTKPFIRDALLTMLDKSNKPGLLSAGSSTADNLRRICVVSFKSGYDPALVCAKLKEYPDVEYAEIMPVHKLLFIPDDPKYSLQYYLNNVRATDAWDVIDTNKTVLIGIVDTGVEYTHVDLADNIFINPGESGLDSNGIDKRFNGIDDDKNGFIDDWHGWDFVSSDSSGQDNDPKPGHKHGTHLAGTCGAVVNNDTGVAGVGYKVKILPVKVAPDDPSATGIENGYEGILYASLMGCKVINCSWGSPTRAESEQEVINTAVSRGSVVVAAAGNDGQLETYYPASYTGAMSVAAVGEADQKAYFSNFSPAVSVSAPGESIYATITGNFYGFMDGTSMASPVAAGVVSLVRNVFPDYTPIQAIEQVKATCDNIDSLNPSLTGYLGKGRVNAYRAVTIKNTKSVILKSYSLTDENNNGLYELGETVKIYPVFSNILSPVKAVNIKISSSSSIKPSILNDSYYVGNMNTLEDKAVGDPFVIKIPDYLPPNYIIQIDFSISDSAGFLNKASVQFVANPSYRNMEANNIHVTINSNGNIGYNDYPNNEQGIGFVYKSGSSLLFEGALIVGVSPTRISDVARDGSSVEVDRAFIPKTIITLSDTGKISKLEAFTSYTDSGLNNQAGVSVIQHVYQFGGDENKDFIITSYDIINNSDNYFDSLYVGLFFDWDIGPSGNFNIADFDYQNGFGFQKNLKDQTLPIVGVKMLSSHKLNYFAIDNDGSGGTNPGIYSGFTYSKKWYMMTSGMTRTTSNITDVSQLISAGPIKLNMKDTARVAFSIFAAKDHEGLVGAANQSKALADSFKIADAHIKPLPTSDRIVSVYPNPLNDRNSLRVQFAVLENTPVYLSIFDLNGKLITSIYEGDYFTRGIFEIPVRMDKFSSGSYYVSLKTNSGNSVFPFVITR